MEPTARITGESAVASEKTGGLVLGLVGASANTEAPSAVMVCVGSPKSDCAVGPLSDSEFCTACSTTTTTTYWGCCSGTSSAHTMTRGRNMILIS